MNKLERYLLSCFDHGLIANPDMIRLIVAEDKADEWKRDSDAALARRARLNGRHIELDGMGNPLDGGPL